ncbi:MAG TPA: AAA family ATPase [Candidatus Paceibacterota bacterium]|nr:AAA family ATPase [Candidatus Paceibacterota bacterium]
MRLKEIEITGFKSFAKKATLLFDTSVTAVVGPNGSGKSNVVEAFRFVLGEQSMKSMRGKSGADLIFRGSDSIGKLSRASVSVTFDNRDHAFAFHTPEGKSPITFDTITFTREIFSDGASVYKMNGSEVRLKQINEILSGVNIGASGHHIISQGEADSILRVNTRDRREMLEEALGLKIYHFRIKESESKLAKTKETLKEVQSLRRELAPHLTFLKKQVEKIEKARSIRTELEDALLRYLASERALLASEDRRLAEAMSLIERKKSDLEKQLATFPAAKATDVSTREIAQARATLSSIIERRRGIEQKISRLEGMIDAQRSMLASRSHSSTNGASITFAPTEYHQIISDIDYFIQAIKNAQTLEAVKMALATLEPIIVSLREREVNNTSDEKTGSTDRSMLKDTALELEDLERDLKKIVAEESHAQSALATLEAERDKRVATSEQTTRERYEVMATIKDCEAELQILAVSKSAFVERTERYEIELKEAGFIFGPSFLHALKTADAIPEVDLHDLKRSIDRLKIRLDEHSGIGEDVTKEYESTVERDAFLSREVTDIEGSIRNLELLIVDLKKVLDEKFTKGVNVINDRFGEFFKTMFGGGSASLSITVEKRRKRKNSDGDEDEELEEFVSDDDEGEAERGIEVHVSLPQKKVKDLQMLSGGERSLVSIALLFAISQVNPPPFLVLDETDAALDEANSRKYGDMLERLAEYSQLILVTHNRETMSRASVLYGVTLGSDGASKLLSIKFDEAVKVAK